MDSYDTKWTYPQCCDKAKEGNGVWWPQDWQKGDKIGDDWVMVQNVYLEFRGSYSLIHIQYCPFCGKKLDKPFLS